MSRAGAGAPASNWNLSEVEGIANRFLGLEMRRRQVRNWRGMLIVSRAGAEGKFELEGNANGISSWSRSAGVMRNWNWRERELYLALEQVRWHDEE
jgi:hypothetical protein